MLDVEAGDTDRNLVLTALDRVEDIADDFAVVGERHLILDP